MMKILLACKEFPHSKVIGGPIIIFNRIKHLSQNHTVSLVAFAKDSDKKFIPSVKSFCHDLRLIPLPKKRTPWKVIRDFLFSPVPHYFLRVHGSSTMAETIAEMVEKDRYDVVIAEYSVMGQFLYNNPLLPPVHRVISVHECYYLARLKDFRFHPFGIKKLKEVFNLKGLKKFEMDMYRDADLVLILTQQGKQELLDIAPDLNIAIVPHGVDVEEFAYSPLDFEEKSIVFVGNYLHFPNADAIVYFYDQIWPILKAKVPETKFTIVGQAPPPEIEKLARVEDIIVTGKVDDVKPFLRKGQVFICPVRLGGGFRGKILESMSIGRPIVSTRLGAEGIPAVHGENILIADEPDRFAQSIADLMNDLDLYSKVQKNGRRLVEDRYAWSEGVKILEKSLQPMMNQQAKNKSKTRET